MARREPYNPVQLNAKTGFVLGYECTTCWAFVTAERTDNHAKWHERQSNSGGNNANIEEANAEVKRIEAEREQQQEQHQHQDEAEPTGQRSRRDPRSSKR